MHFLNLKTFLFSFSCICVFRSRLVLATSELVLQFWASRCGSIPRSPSFLVIHTLSLTCTESRIQIHLRFLHTFPYHRIPRNRRRNGKKNKHSLDTQMAPMAGFKYIYIIHKLHKLHLPSSKS
uniref:Putative secreted protein n=1 Tax=Anopheles marajoara TaxID=58244 RepID=A0A2M4C799_9DIPT